MAVYREDPDAAFFKNYVNTITGGKAYRSLAHVHGYFCN